MMARLTKQALRFAENLSLPTVQVIVMRANMSCKHCQQRASRMVSKMNAGLIDYVVDVPNKEVVMRGVIDLKKKKSYSKISSPMKKRKKFTCLPALHGFKCFGS